MTTLGLLVELRRHGLTLVPDGTGVRVAPKSALTPELRDKVRTHKSDLLAALSIETRILQMPLDAFEHEGCPVEISVPGFPETLWFVPGDRDRNMLVARGIGHGRIWTARELMELWKVPSLTHERARSLAQIKIQFEAEVVSVESLIRSVKTNEGDD